MANLRSDHQCGPNNFNAQVPVSWGPSSPHVDPQQRTAACSNGLLLHRPGFCLISRSRSVLRRAEAQPASGWAPAHVDFFLGTLAPLFRASESAMAMACFLLFTAPPFPPLPERKVPRFLRRIAFRTIFPAVFPYLAIAACPPEWTHGIPYARHCAGVRFAVIRNGSAGRTRSSGYGAYHLRNTFRRPRRVAGPPVQDKLRSRRRDRKPPTRWSSAGCPRCS
jgi:hypothetical protein